MGETKPKDRRKVRGLIVTLKVVEQLRLVCDQIIIAAGVKWRNSQVQI